MPKNWATTAPKVSSTPPMEVASPWRGPAIAPAVKTMPAAPREAVMPPGRGACPGVVALPKDALVKAPKAALMVLAVPPSALLVLPRPATVPNEEGPA